MIQTKHAACAKWLAFWLAASALMAVARPEILDPGRRADGPSILAPIADALHNKNLDVLLSWDSETEFKRYIADPSKSERRVVAPLLGLDRKALSWEDEFARVRVDTARQSWMKEFESGAGTALFACPGNGPSGSANDFELKWINSKREQRVFISFTAADRSYAQALKTELEANGYCVFTYLSESGGPKEDAKTVGRLFATAGEWVVVESPSAEASLGVKYEAEVMRRVRARVDDLARREAIKAQELARAAAERAARDARELEELLSGAIHKGYISSGERLYKLAPGKGRGRKTYWSDGVFYELLPNGIL